MNKGLFLGLAATALLASCSSDEVLDSVEPQAISFENAFVDKSTRADVEDMATSDKVTLKTFYVYGSYSDDGGSTNPELEFKNQEVAANGSYSPLKFWVPGKQYKFAAYSNGNEDIKDGTEKQTDHSVTYAEESGVMVINYTNDGTKDLIYASATASPDDKEYATKVGLTFNHILAKVNFKFTTNFSDGYEVKVSELQIVKLPQKAKFTTDEVSGAETTGTWNTFTGPTEMAYNVGSEITVLTSGGAVSESRYVIPQANNGEELKASFKVKVTNKTSKVSIEKTFAAPLATESDNVWKQAYIYTYTAQITNEHMELGKPIEFEVSAVNDWKGTVSQGTVPSETK